MKLTKRAIDQAEPGAKDYFLWDDELAGFGLRVWPSGRKVYVTQYRQGGRTCRLTLGRHGVLTPDEARTLARKTLAEIPQGKNPREKKAEHPTLRSFGRDFLQEYVPTLKPTTQREYRRLLTDVILPSLGGKRLDQITRQDVARFQHTLREHPAQANKTLAVFSRVFSVAAKWGYAPEGHNPCQGTERYKERGRQRDSSPAELSRLGEVLWRYEVFYPEPVLAVWLLLLTGFSTSRRQSRSWCCYMPEPRRHSERHRENWR